MSGKDGRLREKLQSMITKIVTFLMHHVRAKRSRIFLGCFSYTSKTRILDLGSGDGSHIASIIKKTPVMPENIYIADIDEILVAKGHKNFGFNPVTIPEFGKLPFADKYFDIVFCSSVIEHVKIPKAKVWKVPSGKNFKKLASLSQQKLAAEIVRIGKGYFVQTPNKWFPIECHSWLPFVSYLPRGLLIPFLRLSNRIWVKKTSPDWCLLSCADVKHLFPDAEIFTEKFLGLTKSIMAIKSWRS